MAGEKKPGASKPKPATARKWTGERAYNAYRKALAPHRNGQTLRPWDQVKPADRPVWEDFAKELNKG